MDPKNHSILEKLKKNILTPYLDPLKMLLFLLVLRFSRRFVNTFFFNQNGANFAEPLLWILRTPPILKKFNKIFLTPYLDPLKMRLFLLVLHILQGVRKYFFFIQNGANFAQPL
jgi:hypothetical protein